MTIITEDDLIGRDHKKVQKAKEEDLQTSGQKGASGGRGTREAKTKGKGNNV